MKRKLILMTLTCMLTIPGCISAVEPQTTTETTSSTVENEETSTSEEEQNISTEVKEDQPAEEESSENESAENSTEEISQPDENKTISSGSYTINEIDFLFTDNVRNDTTGNWKISKIASAADATQYATEYYKTLFSSDEEIHAIVNFTTNTTTRISVIMDGTLDVTILEYVENEEHDAKALFGGMLLKEYWINIETGEIEEIQ